MYQKCFFPDNLKDAAVIQKEMASKVIQENDFTMPPKIIAGVDISCNRFDSEKRIFAAIVLLSYPSLTILETLSEMSIQPFPYIPGFLNFREAPALIKLFDKLKIKPDLIMVDGQGISHPRGLGIASHLGIILDIPTIGVAKSILIGKPEKELSNDHGNSVPLIYKEKEIGKVLRTKKKCLPLIISCGHKVSLDASVNFVLNCLNGYRLPEPTRLAHIFANVCRKKFGMR